MLTKFEFHNVDGTHNYTFNTVNSPMTDFDVDVDQRVIDDRLKAQRDGINPTKTNRGKMNIHIEGEILQADSASYFTERQNMILACFGVPNVLVTNRKLGQLVIRLDGATEDWVCDCTIPLFTAPITALSPARSEYAVTFVSFTPWFWGGTTPSNLYYYS